MPVAWCETDANEIWVLGRSGERKKQILPCVSLRRIIDELEVGPAVERDRGAVHGRMGVTGRDYDWPRRLGRYCTGCPPGQQHSSAPG
jgi:hypothetical protein